MTKENLFLLLIEIIKKEYINGYNDKNLKINIIIPIGKCDVIVVN